MKQETLDAGEMTLVELTANIVAAYVAKHIVPVSEMPGLISSVHSALDVTNRPAAVVEQPVPAEKPKPPVSVKKSVQTDHIICLEDGKKFKSLKRHLMTRYGLTPDEYREKWNLPADYPMVAPAYTEARSRLAREAGLGQRRKPK